MTRFSIRRLLIAVAFVALACAALKYAGPVWWAALSLAALLTIMASAVIAIADKGERRFKAISFFVCVVIYASLVFLSPANELHVSHGRLPTTMVMKPIVSTIAPYDDVGFLSSLDVGDITVRSGARDADFSFRSIPSGGGVLTQQPPRRARRSTLIPEHSEFLRIAHLLWAMLFGFLGWMFAGFVYRRNAGAS